MVMGLGLVHGAGRRRGEYFFFFFLWPCFLHPFITREQLQDQVKSSPSSGQSTGTGTPAWPPDLVTQPRSPGLPPPSSCPSTHYAAQTTKLCFCRLLHPPSSILHTFNRHSPSLFFCAPALQAGECWLPKYPLLNLL